jgi:hypothetical protein
MRHEPTNPTRIGLLVATLLAASCTSSGRTDEVITHPDAPPIAPFVECTVYTAREAAASASHVAPCSELAYDVPPFGGPHYSQWAAFGTYDAPVPWGFLVHAMEHGAGVLAYRCEAGATCDSVRSELEAIVAARAPDPLCRGDAPIRYVLAPAPDLEWPIAVLAWEHVYTATCLDRASIDAFLDAHYGRGPESTCADGIDLSASGWCAR